MGKFFGNLDWVETGDQPEFDKRNFSRGEVRHPDQLKDGDTSDVQSAKPRCTVFTHDGWGFQRTEFSISGQHDPKRSDVSLELSVLVSAELSPIQKQSLADYLPIVFEQIRHVVRNR